MHKILNSFLHVKNKKIFFLISGSFIIVVLLLLFTPTTKSLAFYFHYEPHRTKHYKNPSFFPTLVPSANPSLSVTPSTDSTNVPSLTPTTTLTTDPSSDPSLVPTTTSSQTLPQRVDPVCVSSHLDILSQADVDTQTTLMQQAGVNTVRFDFVWGAIEQSPGVYDWSNYDYIVNDVTSKGMHVLALVTQWGAPTWELSDPTNQASPPNNSTDFGTFVQALAAHYKGKISLYEIGNEPNTAEFWPPTPNAQAYTQLLIAGYNGVKAADPTSKVISAGLAMDSDGGVTYLQDMYNDGAKDHFDYLGFHPYSYPSSPLIGGGWGLSSLDNIKAVMTQNGDSSKQIIVTEFGWPSSTAAAGGVDEATQANYINLFYQNIEYDNYQYVPIACNYDFINDGTDTTNPEDNFGVVNYDYTLKPSYSVMQQVSQNYSANFSPINP